MTDNERIQMLGKILASYTDGSTKQLKVVSLFPLNYETTHRERILELVQAIHNGLAYGNWPWIIESMRKK